MHDLPVQYLLLSLSRDLGSIMLMTMIDALQIISSRRDTEIVPRENSYGINPRINIDTDISIY